MRVRVRAAIIAVLMAVGLLLTTVPAHAGDEPVVIKVLGRRLIPINLENGASLSCSAQANFVDTNHNGLGDALVPRAACKENSGVQRLVIYSVRLQSVVADTWATALLHSTDEFSEGQPSYVVSSGPLSQHICPQHINLTYRVRQSFGIRALDGSLTTFKMNSYQFSAPAIPEAQNDVC